MRIPDGHQAIMPYLMLSNAAGFINFTQDVFNAELSMKKLRENDTSIMHAEITTNGSTIMFSDATSQWTPSPASMFIYVEDADHTFAKAIAAGATIEMELSDQPYGRTCGVKDPTGNIWWITSVK